MPDRIARASCIVLLENGVHAGAVGAAGIVSGQSRHGFAVILNAALTGEVHLEGYPVLLFLRHLLDTARSFEEAVEMASHTPLASAALITLAGACNDQRVCIDARRGALAAPPARRRASAGHQPLSPPRRAARLSALRISQPAASPATSTNR